MVTIMESKQNVEENKIKTSGGTREFETGAHRDNSKGKGRCDLIPMDVLQKFFEEDNVIYELTQYQLTGEISFLYSALDSFVVDYAQQAGIVVDITDKASIKKCKAGLILQLSKHYEHGAEIYGENNWQKGMPLSVYLDSAMRHYLKYISGWKDEDHAIAFVWNVFALLWTKEHIHSIETV